MSADCGLVVGDATFANTVDIVEHGSGFERASKYLGEGVALALKDGVGGILVLVGRP